MQAAHNREAHDFEGATPTELAKKVCKHCQLPEDFHNWEQPPAVASPKNWIDGTPAKSRKEKAEMIAAFGLVFFYGMFVGVGFANGSA